VWRSRCRLPPGTPAARASLSKRWPRPFGNNGLGPMRRRTEQPQALLAHRAPVLGVALPIQRCVLPQGQARFEVVLDRADDPVLRRAFDREFALDQVCRLQGREFSAPSRRVGAQPHQQRVLLRPEQSRHQAVRRPVGSSATAPSTYRRTTRSRADLPPARCDPDRSPGPERRHRGSAASRSCR
jgi:hypothetical protein